VSPDAAAGVRERIDRLYRSESRRVLATLIRLLGDFDLAEEALADALTAAMEQWPRDGVPASPRAWLIFICCHPGLPPDAQVAMTLREVCGLTTEEIAGAFLTGPPTVAQRIVRAKARIRAAGIPYQVPPRDELAERLERVLKVVT
jgi:RNA polymerase sigma-70 factor, ECF subfamily